MSRRGLDRRRFLRGLGAATLALPFYRLLDRRVLAAPSGPARRAIFFYFPDGVCGWSFDGMDRWHATGSESSFALSEQLGPLADFKGDCVFLNGLTLGPTDAGSHPGGAKKLLTAVDGGQGESIDRFLARTAGKDTRFPHLYLGVRSSQSSPAADDFISYLGPGSTAPPEDNPLRAFGRLFGTGPGMPTPMNDPRSSVIDAVLADMKDLRGQLGEAEKGKLDQHLAALREVEVRIKGGGPAPTCKDPRLSTGGVEGDSRNWPDYPSLLRAQIDLMVLALSCGLTRVGVLQNCHHTANELIMSGFKEDPDLYTPGRDLRSHEASHHGGDRQKFTAYLLQRKWFVQQFAYLLDRLRKQDDPEGGGNMLDHSVVLLCSEISDGNIHSHDNMPFVVAGKGGGAIRTGRLLTFDSRRHGGLLLAIARAMGQDLPSFGQDGTSGPLPGVLG